MAVKNLDGFPDFDVEAPTLPELPPGATPLQLSRAYGTAVTAWYHRLKVIGEALYWLRGVYHAIHAKVGSIDVKLDQVLNAFERERRAMRQKLPSFSSLDPEQTDGGGIRISQDAFKALQLQVAEHDEALEAAERARVAAEARAQGSAAALADEEKRSTRRLQLLSATLGVLGIVGGFLAWALANLRH